MNLADFIIKYSNCCRLESQILHEAILNAYRRIFTKDSLRINAKLKFGTLCAEVYSVLILLTQKKFTT